MSTLTHKVVLIGNSAVGKTSIISQYIYNSSEPNHVPTIGIDFFAKTLNINGQTLRLQIWDTAGQERYMSVNKNIFQRVQGIILMYDITNRDSFDHLSRWIDLINKNVSNKPFILVGNKLDLSNEERIVAKEEGEKVALDNNIEFFEGSGSSGENVDKIFSAISDKVYKHLLDERNDVMEKNININSVNNYKKICC